MKEQTKDTHQKKKKRTKQNRAVGQLNINRALFINENSFILWLKAGFSVSFFRYFIV